MTTETRDSLGQRFLITIPPDSGPAWAREWVPGQTLGSYLAEPIPAGEHQAQVREIGPGRMEWITLIGPAWEGRVVGLPYETWARFGAKLRQVPMSGPGPMGEAGSVSIADSPPAAAGGPSPPVPIAIVGADPVPAGRYRARTEDGHQFEVDIHADLGRAEFATPVRLCGHPLAVSGVVVPEAEGEGDRGGDDESIETAKNVASYPGQVVNGYVGRLRAEVERLKAERIPGTGISGAVCDVLEFHRRFAPEVLGERPALPTLTANQRVRLENMAHVIGDTKYIRDADRHYAIGFILEELAETLRAVARGDLAGTTDGLTDLAYVVIRAALTMGIDLARPWDAVHAKNLTKTGSTIDGQGKVVKSEEFVPVRLDDILATQRPLSESYPPIP